MSYSLQLINNCETGEYEPNYQAVGEGHFTDRGHIIRTLNAYALENFSQNNFLYLYQYLKVGYFI